MSNDQLSDEEKTGKTAGETASTASSTTNEVMGPGDTEGTDGAAAEASENEDELEAVKEPPRVDADGLPLDRDATIDDVRSRTGFHGRIAMGCTVGIILLIVLFWLIRSSMG